MTTADPPPAAAPRRDVLRDELFQHLEDITGVGAWTWEPGTGLTSWSDQLLRILGLEGLDRPLTVDSYLEMTLPEDREVLKEAVLQGLRHRGTYALDHRIVRTDGATRTVHSRGRSERGPDGLITYALGTVQDVTEARGAERDLARARDLFAGVLDSATEQSIIGVDPAGMITVFNTGAERLLGYAAGEMIGLETPPELHLWSEVEARAAELGVEPDHRVILGQAMQGEPESRQWTYLAKDGRHLQVMITTTAVRGIDGSITGFIKVGTDITARVDAEAALRASEALFEQVFDNAPTGMLLADASGDNPGRILRANVALTRITGYTPDQLIGMPLQNLVHPEQQQVHRDGVEALAHGRSQLQEAERRWVHADGRDIWVQASGTAVRHDGKQLVIAMIENITDRKEAEQRLHHLALHDALTGLPNRSLLLDRLEHALAATLRSGTRVAVFYLDLDGFKSVNDAAGHLAGDEVLLMVAHRLREHLRPGDTVARIGGDEFVVVCPDFTDESATVSLAQRLLSLLAEPYTRGRTVHHLSASIGVAVSRDGIASEELLREADDAMYIAKDDGKNRVHRSGTHNPETLTRTARAARHLQIEAELRHALEYGELVMHGQPVLALPSREVIAVETLLRWNHPSRGLLAPAEFLDVVENSPLMTPVGRRVLTESCRIAAAIHLDDGRPPPTVYVNISGRQLESGNLHEDVLHALESSGLAPDRLVLELTETTTPLIAGSLMDDIDDLRRRGVRLSIDDVGTGYSSLSRLTELPVDLLKIDRSFVARLGHHTAVDAVVRAILSIGRSIGLQIVAEGVETDEQAAMLVELGCHTAQGYLFSRPRPESELLALPGVL